MTAKFYFDYVFSAKTLVLGTTALIMSACATTEQPRPTQRPAPITQVPDTNTPRPDTPAPIDPVQDDKTDVTVEPDDKDVFIREGLTPPHMTGRDVKRMALLLPFSSKNARLREEATSMLQAAEMAIFERAEPDTLLIALDTAGTPRGARKATTAAVDAGADIILGPIVSNSVKAVSREARKSDIPVIAFSTDQSVAGGGTYLLSIPPEVEVQRVVDYAASTGATRFAYIGPDNRYGRRVNAAYQNSVRAVGGSITASESYDGNDITVMQEPARALAETFKANARLVGPSGPMAFEAVLLPEGGTALRSLAPLLPYYSDAISNVQFMGTGLWHREDTVREPALNGGIFAGPDQDAQAAFNQSYDRAFGTDPTRLASQAYDAVTFGIVIADGDPKLRRARAEDPNGFFGADGLVQFQPDGTPERGLAVYQIRNGRFVVIDPAPRTTLGPG